ncbi:MAG: restriction endonuclease subunit S [Geodermatophilaceae bacterium]|nr:restriction endonuclease subunit S [Geodermatophilaceae bacterium]
MTVDRDVVGRVLRLDRVLVQPDPTLEYSAIGVRSFGKGIFHYEPKLGAQLGSLRFFQVEPNRLVVSNIKGWEGAIAVSSEADAACLASNRFLSYVPIDGRIDVRWARWYFLSEQGIELIQRASPGSADRNRTLAIGRFEALEIPLPDIDEQRRVADRLDRLKAAADELARRSGQASALSSALMVSASSRPDLDDREKQRAGWRRVPLRTVMNPASDVITVDAKASYPNVGIYSFGRGLFPKPDIEGSKTSAKTLTRIHAGQFIYSRLFAFEGAYAYVTSAFDGFLVSNEFPTFDADVKQLNTKWLANYFRSPERWAELRGASKGLGVRRQRVPVEAVLSYEVWLPPIEWQDKIVATIDRVEESRSHGRTSAQRVGALIPAALNNEFASFN